MPTLTLGLASDTNTFQVAHRTGGLLRKLLRINTKGTEKPWQFIRSMGAFFDYKFQFPQTQRQYPGQHSPPLLFRTSLVHHERLLPLDIV